MIGDRGFLVVVVLQQQALTSFTSPPSSTPIAADVCASCK